MAKRYPLDFRRGVVAVARKGDATLAQISKDFGISNATLHNWLIFSRKIQVSLNQIGNLKTRKLIRDQFCQ